MALRSTHLAANAADRRSRALHRFIVASPILLLVAVGLVGHLRHPPYPSPGGSPDYDRRVLAYRERVLAVAALPQDDAPPLKPYFEEAQRWLAGFDSGTLTTLSPAVYEDHLRDGPRGEAFRAGMTVASGLAAAAERAVEDKRNDEAATAALAAAQVSNRLRDFELQACLQALLVERRSVGILARIWPSLSSDRREEIRKRLTGLRVDPREVDRLSKIENDQIEDYFRRQRLTPDQRQLSTYQFADQAEAAIRRSIRMGNARIDALLKGNGTPTTVEELP